MAGDGKCAENIWREMWSAPKSLYRSWCQHDILAINQRQNKIIRDILRSNPLRRNSLFLRRNRTTDHSGSKYPYWFKVIKYSYPIERPRCDSPPSSVPTHKISSTIQTPNAFFYDIAIDIMNVLASAIVFLSADASSQILPKSDRAALRGADAIANLRGDVFATVPDDLHGENVST